MGDLSSRKSSYPVPGGSNRNARLLLDLVVWRVFASLGAPFRRFIVLLMFLGTSLSTLVAELQRLILSSIGWLSAPPSLPVLRHLGQSFLHTRRWHFGAGNFPGCCFLDDGSLFGVAVLISVGRALVGYVWILVLE